MQQQLFGRYNDEEKQIRRRYFSSTLTRLVVFVSLGTLVALAEHLAFVPSVFSKVFPLPDKVTLSLSGAFIGSTAMVPILFFIGMSPAWYYYASQILISAFGFFQGGDIWHYLFMLFQGPPARRWMILLLVLWILCVGCLVMRIHATATQGIYSKDDSIGIRPSRYFSKMIEYWGAMMILRALFYGMYVAVC